MALAAWLRLVALVLIAVWTSLRIEPPTVHHYWLLIALLAAVGYLQVPLSRLAGPTGRLLQAALISLDMAILAWALLVPPPGSPGEWSMAMQFRLGNIVYVLVFVALAGLTYHPFLALWTAFSAMAAWLVATLVALADGRTYTILDLGRFQEMDASTLRATLLDPDYLSAVERAQEALLTLVIAGIVAVGCWRARHLVRREIESSAERANLARYFSPGLVARLSSGVDLRGSTAHPKAAILFADLVGFTRFAENLPPDAVIEVLRDFHGRMARAVFAHGGILHKFLGDGFMASFGATDIENDPAQPAAAVRALDCFLDIETAMTAWNDERAARDLPPLRLALGLHVGPVVTGDVGDVRCLEFAILGDTVNIASRLEGLCRPFEAAAVISREVALAAPGHPALEAFEPVPGETGIRGRDAAMQLLRLPRRAHSGATGGPPGRHLIS